MTTSSDINYDETGNLVTGLFYHFLAISEDAMLESPEIEAASFVSRRPKWQSVNWMAVETDVEQVGRPDSKGCVVHPDHLPIPRFRVSKVDCIYGDAVADFIPDMHLWYIVSELFRKSFADSKLTGATFRSPLISRDCAPVVRPGMSSMELVGAACQRDRYRLEAGISNQCPHCGFGPLLCPNCHFCMGKCFNCHRPTMVMTNSHKGAGDVRLRMGRSMLDGVIIEGCLWDGSDFIYDGYITSRALKWLKDRRSAPFFAVPVRLCVDGMTEDQKRKLDELKKYM